MAQSSLPEMEKRLERVESDVGEIKGALVHITHILIAHGDRLDNLAQRFDGLNQRFDGLNQRVDGLDRRLESFQESVAQRLDRLIDVTLRARTADAERFLDVERRLARLEERVGV